MVGNEGRETKDYVKVLRHIYAMMPRDMRSKAIMVDDGLRAWSARADDASGKPAVGADLDAVMINKSTVESLRAIGKIIDGLGFKGEGEKNVVRFYFWEAKVPVESPRGFIGPYMVMSSLRGIASSGKPQRSRISQSWILLRSTSWSPSWRTLKTRLLLRQQHKRGS